LAGLAPGLPWEWEFPWEFPSHGNSHEMGILLQVMGIPWELNENFDHQNKINLNLIESINSFLVCKGCEEARMQAVVK
jgi:hypothetical protein